MKYPTVRHVLRHGSMLYNIRGFALGSRVFYEEDIARHFGCNKPWSWSLPKMQELSHAPSFAHLRWRPAATGKIELNMSPAIKGRPPRWAHRAWKRGLNVRRDRRTGRWI